MLDQTDSLLLQALQTNAQLTAQELGDILNLSASQAGRRRQRLEEEGYITGFRASLDPVKLGLSVQAFIQVSMVTHSPDAARSFQALIRARPGLAGLCMVLAATFRLDHSDPPAASRSWS